MRKTILTLALASSVALSGCAANRQNGDIAQGAAGGAVAGAAIGAVVPGVNVIEGKLTYEAVAEAHGLDYTPLDDVLPLSAV